MLLCERVGLRPARKWVAHDSKPMMTARTSEQTKCVRGRSTTRCSAHALVVQDEFGSHRRHALGGGDQFQLGACPCSDAVAIDPGSSPRALLEGMHCVRPWALQIDCFCTAPHQRKACSSQSVCCCLRTLRWHADRASFALGIW